MDHTWGASIYRKTQGKIECWHQTLKYHTLREDDYLPDDLEQRIADFIRHYNHVRYQDSIANVPLADVYLGGRKPAYNNVKGSNIRHSKKPKLAPQQTSRPKVEFKMRQTFHPFRPHEG
jgi:hypothetical protein